MAYEARPLRRQKILYNNANDASVLKYQLLVDGAKATPDAAPTITIYAPGNSTALVGPVAMTLSGTVSTYSADTTTVASWPVQTGYRAHVISTVGGLTYEDELIFDVCKFLLLLDVGRDQLVGLDERVATMAHAGDEDFSEIIEAVRDELQTMIESRVIGDKKLIENMILDKSRIAMPARLYMLAQIFEEKADPDQADRYRERADTLWRAVMDSIQYDSNQDLEEDAKIGGPQGVRITY